ncbi:cation/H(+) antiporter 15-like [Senna tora]|uniref:Cation/H(+) antiporter 15-like n=1 Tax=Senna tora TaxID=362788 RepID=A0A834TYX3_9FABA|nr:cation/H(+) antiporter 15-like [Senna tora]
MQKRNNINHFAGKKTEKLQREANSEVESYLRAAREGVLYPGKPNLSGKEKERRIVMDIEVGADKTEEEYCDDDARCYDDEPGRKRRNKNRKWGIFMAERNEERRCEQEERRTEWVERSMAGIIIGPTFLGKDKAYMDNVYLPRQSDVLAVGALFGAIYSVFIVTLKMDIVLTWRSARRTWKLGVIPYLASFCILFVLLSIYPVPTLETPFERFILSANASFSNFAVICQSMMDLNLLTSELGQIAMSSAFVNDLFHWVFIVLMYVMINRSRPGGQHSSILLMSSFFAFTVTLLVIVRPLLLLVARTTPVGKPVRKTYVILILASVPVTAFIGDVIGISFLYGPLFYGLIVPNGPPLGATILQKSETLVDELFMPLVWAYFGKNIDLFTLRDWGFIMKFSIFILSGYLAKLIGCILISLTYKIRLKHGLVLGLMLNVKGNARSMISLIEACNPILSSAICAYVVHLIELQGRSTPVLLPVDMQRRTFSSFNYPITNHIMRAFNNYTTNSNGYVTILPYINISPYKNMHEAVCNLAEDKMVSFLIVPFHENDLTRGSQMTTFIRDLNFNFHAYAPCTQQQHPRACVRVRAVFPRGRVLRGRARRQGGPGVGEPHVGARELTDDVVRVCSKGGRGGEGERECG